MKPDFSAPLKPLTPEDIDRILREVEEQLDKKPSPPLTGGLLPTWGVGWPD